MPHVSDLDKALDEYVFATTDRKPTKKGTGKITLGFNILLFTFITVLSLLQFLVASPQARGISLMGLVLTCTLDTLRFAVVALISAFFVKVFWERLAPSLFAVRALTYQEAIACVLMIGLLTSN